MIEKDTIKGLECCTDEWYENCNECPYSIDTVSCERMKLLEDSLDLINHKQGLPDAAIAGQETLQKALAEKEREIERLKNKVFCSVVNDEEKMRNIVNEKVAEFELDIELINAEAIKALAERLKQRSTANSDINYYILKKLVDNLVKEMVGDAE